MRPFAVILLLASGAVSQVYAQSFLDELKEKKPGEGTITVTQSKDIDELVNSAVLVKSQSSAASNTCDGDKNTQKKATERNAEHAKNYHARDSLKEPHNVPSSDSTAETAAASNAKKVMRNSKKITGYRIQVFSGGNSREDRIKAESTGNSIKKKYPSLPVYVHFYSPRWICRAGNFRTYQEAEAVLKELKSMGYGQACIVKGTITVAY